MDAVGCRALVCYCGEGTLYCPAHAVTRSSTAPAAALLSSLLARAPAPIIESVDPAAVIQARPFDVLLLKGSAHLHARGVDGAVHASPHADEGAPRLLLTVDDVAVCGGKGCGC